MILGKKPTLGLMLAPLLEPDYLGPPRPWHCISQGNFKCSLNLFFVAYGLGTTGVRVLRPIREGGASSLSAPSLSLPL